MELTIETTEKLVDLDEVESTFLEGLKFFKEISKHKYYAEKHTIFSFESAQFTLKQLTELNIEIINGVTFIEKINKQAAEHKEKTEYYRKLISPFLDGNEEERILAFLNSNSVVDGTEQLSIKDAFEKYDSYRNKFVSDVDKINKTIKSINTNSYLLHSCRLSLKNIRNVVLKRYNEFQKKADELLKTIETIDMNVKIIVG